MTTISLRQRVIVSSLYECKLSYCLFQIEALPEFLLSSYERGIEHCAIIDHNTGEVLSQKHDIVFADSHAGYFVYRTGKKIFDADNEFKLVRNKNMHILKDCTCYATV